MSREEVEIEYEPRSVKAVLTEMKNTAELLIDLSYSAVLFERRDLAEEVLELESEMDRLQIHARMALLMAARNPDDAESLAPVLGIVSATAKISDAAGDVAKVVLEEMGLPDEIKHALPEAVETLVRAEVCSASTYAGQTLGDANLETETGVRVIAIRRGGDWLLNPDRDTRVEAGDTLLCRGPERGLVDVYEGLTGEAYDPPEPGAEVSGDFDRAAETLVLMKDVSELGVDLAYGALLFDNDDLAAEVLELEVEMDALQARFEAWLLEAAADVPDPVSLRGLLHIASSTEVISDAAVEISEGVLRGVSTHPVVVEAVEESDEVIVRVSVAPDSALAGETIGDVAVRSETGMQIVAVRRGDGDATDRRDWELSPGAETTLHAGDVLIAKGTAAGADRLRELAT
ncbi:MAG: potassium channel family protein [Halobacteriaceae archaeon]